MKILFVYPGISWTGFNGYYKKPNYFGSWVIPVGICYLARLAIEEGYEVDLLDLRFVADFGDVENKIVQSGCHIVALSFQTPDAYIAYDVAKIAKRHGKITLAGGIHPSVMPDDVLNTGLFDHVFIGEGCITFPEVIRDLEKEKNIPVVIKGQHIVNLDEIPFPYFFDLYADTVIKNRKQVAMFTSRGCPGKCTYCKPVVETLFGHRIIFRSADNILAEVRYWKEKYDIESFLLFDDTFMVKKKLVIEFCENLISGGLGLKWSCNARVNEFDEETINLMAKSGCVGICIGFESGSKRMLDFFKKRTTLEQAYNAASLCHKYNIDFTTNLILGVPGETEDDYLANFEFVKKAKAKNVQCNCLVPYPGTEMFDYCIENDLIDKDMPWDRYSIDMMLDRGFVRGVDYNLVDIWKERLMWNTFLDKLIKDGNQLEAKNDLDRALFKYKLVIEFFDEFYHGYFFCGKIYKKKGRLLAAKRFLKKALHIITNDESFFNGTFDVVHMGSICFHLGEIYYIFSNLKVAKKYFGRCLSFMPDHVKASEYMEQNK